MTESVAHDAPPPLAQRLRRGVRHSHNWTQLIRFGCVGASGYIINLTVFTVCVAALALGHRPAAVAAFLVAVANNFALNRRWTFDADPSRWRAQAVRFAVTSVAAFLGALLVLELLIAAGVPDVAAQAISIVCAMPVNFVANKVWSFSA